MSLGRNGPRVPGRVHRRTGPSRFERSNGGEAAIRALPSAAVKKKKKKKKNKKKKKKCSPAPGRSTVQWTVTAAMVKLHNLHNYYHSGEQTPALLKGVDLHIRAGGWCPSWIPQAPANPRLWKFLGVFSWL